MNWIDRVHALDLDNHDIVHDQVNAISELDLLSLVNHRQSNLTGDCEALLSKLMQQAALIGAFEESRPKHGMNSHRGADDLMCDVVYSGSSLLRCGSHQPAISQLRVLSLCSLCSS